MPFPIGLLMAMFCQPPAPVSAAVLRVTSEPFGVSVSVRGVLQPDRVVEASAPVTGRVTGVVKRVGAWVHAGELVARVNDTPLHSPASGQIERISIPEGEQASAGTTVFTVADNDRLVLSEKVEAARLNAVESGQQVLLTVDSRPAGLYRGRVLDAADGTIRIRVPNAGQSLRAGMFASARVFPSDAPDLIAVPVAALHGPQTQPYVFVVENGRAVRKNLRTGRTRDGLVEVLDGLKPGERLIAERNPAVAEGVAVEPRE